MKWGEERGGVWDSEMGRWGEERGEGIPLSSVAKVPLYKLVIPPSLRICLAQSMEPAYLPFPGEDCWI